MFEIQIQQGSKHYNYQWIFKDINFTFKSANQYAIIGSNGVGKSTLLSCISGSLSLNKGLILYTKDAKSIDVSEVYKYLFIITPYTDLIEEMTLKELFTFFRTFKFSHYTFLDFLAYLDLKNVNNKIISTYSSGMKQKVKLALAFSFEIPILLLDEPTTNLDQNNIKWYLNKIEDLSDRLIIIASNDKREYDFCKHQISL